ncbi:MAG: YbaB/EbfC family nucleoid-associated protein [Acidobacteria bacterium]|nr:MAG: YbaB/EbfC family nucleoid-associated protein [Acidobacteriota bacterium]
MSKMLQKAQKMQAKMQEEIAALRIEASAGGGAVRATVDGQKNLLALEIESDVLADAGAEMVADLVLAAVRDAQGRVDDEVQKKMADLAGAMGLPPGIGF